MQATQYPVSARVSILEIDASIAVWTQHLIHIERNDLLQIEADHEVTDSRGCQNSNGLIGEILFSLLLAHLLHPFNRRVDQIIALNLDPLAPRHRVKFPA